MTDTAIPKQTQKLIVMLTRQTGDGKRIWERGSAETEFIFAQEAGSVIVSSKDGDGMAPFELRILDPSGTVVESYSTGAEGAEYLGMLYEAARRSTIRSSPVVDHLVESLEDDIPF